jgi:hypothetical protein
MSMYGSRTSNLPLDVAKKRFAALTQQDVREAKQL